MHRKPESDILPVDSELERTFLKMANDEYTLYSFYPYVLLIF